MTGRRLHREESELFHTNGPDGPTPGRVTGDAAVWPHVGNCPAGSWLRFRIKHSAGTDRAVLHCRQRCSILCRSNHHSYRRASMGSRAAARLAG